MEQSTEERLASIGDRISRILWETDRENWERIYTPDGSARTRDWQARDGWLISYSTERARGGPFDGRFVVMLYRPVGKGSRIGKATEWKRTYFRGFATRATAKRRAVALWYQHGTPEMKASWDRASQAERREMARRA